MKKCTRCFNSKSLSDFYKRKAASDGHESECKSCRNRRSSEWQKSNMPKVSKITRKWYLENKEKMDVWRRGYESKNKARLASQRKGYAAKIAAYEKSRRVDPVYRVARSCRVRLSHAIRSGGWAKPGKTQELLGADFATVKSWLESKFKPGMSWGNYGRWHIDHRIPLGAAATVAELAPLAHYSNLQPMWASENCSKGKKTTWT